MELFKVSGTSDRVIKIVLSVSVLSLLFSFLPFLFQSLNQFSINKSYVFLFCNGLVAVIAKNSSLPSDHSSSHHQFNDLDVAAPVHNSMEHDIAAADSAEQQEEEEKRMIVAFTDSQEEDEVISEEEEVEEEEEKRIIVADNSQEEEEEEKRIIVADNSQEEEEEEEEEEEGSNNGVWMTEEEEEEEEVEELNKKCEDFIRKMKAAFCSEPFYHHTSAMVTTVR